MEVSTNRWQVRLIVCLTMLALAGIGLIVMNISERSYWIYTCVMAGIYAMLSIWLFWYLNREEPKNPRNTIWHHLLHWLGLFIAMYLVSIFISTGLITSAQAGIIALTLLSLTIFLAGVYTDSSFMLIGLTLAAFAAGAALISKYLTTIMIPIIVVAAVIIFVVVYRGRRKSAQS